MSTGTRITFVITLLLALILAACSPGEQGLPDTGEEGTPGLPAEAVLNAQQWLAVQLSAQVEQVAIVEMEQEVWTDSCLGLGQPNESCLAADTPGWRVIFEVNGEQYEVRTDETGTEIRLATPVGTPEGTPN